MANEDLIRAEWVPVRAAARWTGDPLAVRRLHQLAQHIHKGMSGDGGHAPSAVDTGPGPTAVAVTYVVR
jgi:hypothetical protein